MTDHRCDIAVIGAGIGGASAAACLAPDADVLVLEAEAAPAMHTTGRSAAFFAETYGGPKIMPLTRAAKGFFLAPPEDFSETPLVARRGALHVFAAEDRAVAEALVADAAAHGIETPMIDGGAALLERVPVLRPGLFDLAVFDTACKDMDVHAIHGGFLKKLKAHGGRVLCDARVRRIERMAGAWMIETTAGTVRAARIVNAAGAWADEVARLAGVAPKGLRPLRRTIVTFTPEGLPIDPAWPVVIDGHERWYFKPESGRILASPADETPMAPCDAQPDEMDVAIAADRIMEATIWDIRRIQSKWAGLRTFAPDRAPIVGPDPAAPDFIWCAGQGGFGIQTSPSVGALTAALTLSHPLPDALVAAGVDPALYAPGRF